MEVEEHDLSLSLRGLIVWGMVTEVTLVLIAVCLSWVFGLKIGDWVVWSWWSVGGGILAVLPMVGCFEWLWRWNPPTLRHDREVLLTVLGRPLSRAGWGLSLLIGLTAGIGEELLFRGAMQTMLTGWWGLAWAAIVVNLGFGMMHAISVWYVLLAGLAGLYLTGVDQFWLLVSEILGEDLGPRNLLPAVIAHGVYDFYAFLRVANTWKQTRSKDDQEIYK